ncbi:hypothetical protein ECANGB1_2222 [Enterospora canceri]|uniref:Uncharacterized protein n=1 Tax=Enterospora canceri TaxID=1081671 RepID=A0A1Y1S9U8_9MICR|nr:hypothetical protein ECANGB1_2222 [Enterospora canceri]
MNLGVLDFIGIQRVECAIGYFEEIDLENSNLKNVTFVIDKKVDVCQSPAGLRNGCGVIELARYTQGMNSSVESDTVYMEAKTMRVQLPRNATFNEHRACGQCLKLTQQYNEFVQYAFENNCVQELQIVEENDPLNLIQMFTGTDSKDCRIFVPVLDNHVLVTLFATVSVNGDCLILYSKKKSESNYKTHIGEIFNNLNIQFRDVGFGKMTMPVVSVRGGTLIPFDDLKAMIHNTIKNTGNVNPMDALDTMLTFKAVDEKDEEYQRLKALVQMRCQFDTDYEPYALEELIMRQKKEKDIILTKYKFGQKKDVVAESKSSTEGGSKKKWVVPLSIAILVVFGLVLIGILVMKKLKRK